METNTKSQLILFVNKENRTVFNVGERTQWNFFLSIDVRGLAVSGIRATENLFVNDRDYKH